VTLTSIIYLKIRKNCWLTEKSWRERKPVQRSVLIWQ